MQCNTLTASVWLGDEHNATWTVSQWYSPSLAPRWWHPPAFSMSHCAVMSYSIHTKIYPQLAILHYTTPSYHTKIYPQNAILHYTTPSYHTKIYKTKVSPTIPHHCHCEIYLTGDNPPPQWLALFFAQLFQVPSATFAVYRITEL